jgi:hypothetical protein
LYIKVYQRVLAISKNEEQRFFAYGIKRKQAHVYPYYVRRFVRKMANLGQNPVSQGKRKILETVEISRIFYGRSVGT